MPYEMLSRALAYVSCLTTASLLATSMAMAAVNIGLMNRPHVVRQLAPQSR